MLGMLLMRLSESFCSVGSSPPGLSSRVSVFVAIGAVAVTPALEVMTTALAPSVEMSWFMAVTDAAACS